MKLLILSILTLQSSSQNSRIGQELTHSSSQEFSPPRNENIEMTTIRNTEPTIPIGQEQTQINSKLTNVDQQIQKHPIGYIIYAAGISLIALQLFLFLNYMAIKFPIKTYLIMIGSISIFHILLTGCPFSKKLPSTLKQLLKYTACTTAISFVAMQITCLILMQHYKKK